MINFNVADLYFEEYDDQTADDFEYVGIEGKEPVPITDLTRQVNEYRRLHGRNVAIRVYRRQVVPC